MIQLTITKWKISGTFPHLMNWKQQIFYICVECELAGGYISAKKMN